MRKDFLQPIWHIYSVLGGVREDSSCKYLPPTFHRQVAQYSPCQRWLVGCHYLYKTFYEGQKPNFGQLDMVAMDIVDMDPQSSNLKVVDESKVNIFP